LVLVDYEDLWKYALFIEEKNASLKRDFVSQQQRAQNWRDAAETQKKRGDFLGKMWDEEHKFRLQLEAKNKWHWVPWALVVVESVVFAGIGAYAFATAPDPSK